MKAKAYIVHRAMCEPELEWSKPKDCLSADPLYTTPPQRTWIELTDDEINLLAKAYSTMEGELNAPAFARAILRKAQEK